MQFKYVRGDMFDGDLRKKVLVCPVCSVPGVMGAGLAKQFVKRWPNLREVHRQVPWQPGMVYAQAIGPLTVLMVATKLHWDKKSKYTYVMAGLSGIYDYLNTISEERKGWICVRIPPLGCGLGRLEWEKVRPMIELMCNEIGGWVRFEVYEPDPIDLSRGPRWTPG